MDFVTTIITKIVAIERSEEIPQTSNIPKCLLIHTLTTGGPVVLQISEIAAVELQEELAKYAQARGSR